MPHALKNLLSNKIKRGLKMDLGLARKTVLVCGASQGLGFAVAKELSSEGCTVIICSRDKDRIQRAAKRIEAETGGKVLAHQVDLSQTDQVVQLAKLVKSAFDKIDILVNNTGGPPAGFFMDFNEQDWSRAFQGTLMSTVTLTKQLLPLMVQHNWGRVINLQSIAVKQPIDDLLLSNSIRMAVVGWAKTVANQYAKYNITINTIATGYTLTERLSDLAKKRAENENVSVETIMNRWKAKIPMQRLARPEEIAWLVTFLASEKAAYITGKTIAIDGGVVQNML
jgi:3-oxoacyl-[acyl-carrier protein] reductase